MNNNEEKPIRGGRNLIILGLGAIAIALISTAASLQIYRSTGDIFLDRSRPGYIFEDEKHNVEDDQKERFSNEGELNDKAVDEYINELNTVMTRIQSSTNDFSQEPISDETLNIYVQEEAPEEAPQE